jgi:hypothetical protein
MARHFEQKIHPLSSVLHDYDSLFGMDQFRATAQKLTPPMSRSTFQNWNKKTLVNIIPNML